MRKGDIILVPFPFTDLTGSKERPALVLATDEWDVMVAFVSSRIKHINLFDIVLEPDSQNGLKRPSRLRLNKISTVERKLVLGELGKLSTEKMEEADRKLKSVLGLP